MKQTKRNRIGSDHPNYRSGKTVSHGYVVLTSKVWGDNRGRYEHRVIMEQALGRKLLDEEVVHHKNGITTDNRIDNLEVLTDRAVHNRLHGTGSMMVCQTCKSQKWYSATEIKKFRFGASQYHCGGCASVAIYEKPCRRCGATFHGKRNAGLCPACRKRRLKKAAG